MSNNLLIVDDEIENLEFLTILLRKKYTIHVASSGAQALDLVQINPPDIILLDFMMPSMSGIEVCQALQNDPEMRHIPIVFLSASGDINNKVSAFEAGAVDYIVKPCSAHEIMARLNLHLSINQMNQALMSEIEMRLSAEEELEKSEARYRQLANKMHAGILIFAIGEDGKLVLKDLNNEATTILRQPSETLINCPVDEVFGTSEFEPLLSSLEILLHQGTSQNKPLITYENDQLVRWLESNCYQISKDEMVVVLDDITSRKQAEAELALIERTRLVLKQEDTLRRLKSQIVTTVSHELRTPLAIISSSANLLQKYSNQMTPEKIEIHFKQIDTQISHLSELIQAIVTLEEGNMSPAEFNPTRFSIKELVESVIEAYRQQYQPSNTITLDIQGKHYGVRLDKTIITHLITHLLDNAVQYSPSGDPIHVYLTLEKESIRIGIEDRGIGILEEDMTDIFNPFTRGKNVGTIAGVGLGLAFVKHAVEVHGGTISVDSSKHGTLVSVTFPRVFTNPPSASYPKS